MNSNPQLRSMKPKREDEERATVQRPENSLDEVKSRPTFSSHFKSPVSTLHTINAKLKTSVMMSSGI